VWRHVRLDDGPPHIKILRAIANGDLPASSLPGRRRSVMAELTKLESKLGEVPGLAMAVDEVEG
jgi:hypothetical protein